MDPSTLIEPSTAIDSSTLMISAGALVVALALVPLALAALAVPYFVLRLKTETPPDSQFGLKIAFHFFFSASCLLAVSGTTVIITDWMVRDSVAIEATYDNPLARRQIDELFGDGFNIVRRIGLGIAIAGVVGMAAHLLLIHGTTRVHHPRIRRMFIGLRFAVHGAILLFALMLLMIQLLMKDSFQRPALYVLRGTTAVTVVWLASWFVHLKLLFDAAQATARSPAAATEGDSVEAAKSTATPRQSEVDSQPTDAPEHSTVHSPGLDYLEMNLAQRTLAEELLPSIEEPPTKLH